MTDKKAWIDKLHYEIDKQQGNLELAYAWLDNEKNPKFSKWKKSIDCDDDFIKKANNRTILPNEIVLDIEEPERFSDILENVKKEFEFFSVYRTGSKGYHIHLWFNEALTPEEKLYVIKEYGCDEQKSSSRCMIALENVPHWKTGNKKELVKEKCGFNGVKKIKSLGFNEIYPEEISSILDATIKEDKTNKILTFFGEISAYTEDCQFNISNQAPSSTGKSYVPIEIASLFPEEDVIMVGYCSPTAFFHDRGGYDKETNTIQINLEGKILIFLDQPHTLLLQHLRPILSHDKKEIKLKITDKSQKAGLRTKNVIIRGYPVVIFCSAGLRLDEQEATRFLMLSPETTQQKIRRGIIEKIKRNSNEKKYLLDLDRNPKRKQLKDRILRIKEANIKEIIISEKLSKEIENRFFNKIKSLKPRHQRDIGRIIAFAKISALLNLWFRNRQGNKIEVFSEDVNEAFNLWGSISESQELNIPPYVYQIFKEVILKAYNEKGLSRKDILKKHIEIYGRVLPEWLLKQQIIPMLENAGLISSEPDPNDKRRVLYSPTTQLHISQQQNNIELEGWVEQDKIDFSELDKEFKDG